MSGTPEERAKAWLEMRHHDAALEWREDDIPPLATLIRQAEEAAVRKALKRAAKAAKGPWVEKVYESCDVPDAIEATILALDTADVLEEPE